jgi:hypothetical protein
VAGVDLIFRLSAAGLSIAETEQAFVSHSYLNKSGRPLNQDATRYIIATRFYLGEITFRGEYYGAKHDRQIDPDLLEAGQRPAAGPMRGDRPNTYVYILSKVVAPQVRVSEIEGEPCDKPMPLLPRWANGCGGTKHYNYYRADSFQGLGAASLQIPVKV